MKHKSVYMAGGLLAAASAAAVVASKKIKESNPSKDVIAENVAKALNPISAEAGSTLQSVAFLESMAPSLMTRSSSQQGVATATSILGAKGVSGIVETVTNNLLGEDRSYANRMFTRGVIGISGNVLSNLPHKENESLVVSGVRSAGRLLEVASISGAIYDSLKTFEKDNKKNKLLPLAIGTMFTAGLIYRGKTMIKERRDLINTVPEDPANKIIPATIAGLGVIQLSRLIGLGFRSSHRGIKKWLGHGPLKNNLAKGLNIGLWSSAAVGAYFAGVTKIGQANEKMEPGYSTPPTNENVSGSPQSLSNFEDLGLQGRRYVTDIIDKYQIKKVTGKTAKNSPVRVYIGYNSDEKYSSARAEAAINELIRTNAFKRKYLLLVSPTGTGWIDQTMIESAELLSGGDIATCVVQYAKYPSFLSLQKVVDGRRQFRRLLWSIKMHLSQMPESKKPEVIVFGESLGAWSSSDTVMYTGIDGFDYYGISRALWVGMPGLSRWGKIERGETDVNVPKGTIGVFDNPNQFDRLTRSQKDKLRAIILNHDNDPIAQLRPNLLIKKPKWLNGNNRGRGVPTKMEWSPIITFFQIAIDAANAMRVTPGEFRSHGHDYRADMAYFVNEAYRFGANEQTVQSVNNELVRLELERANRDKQESGSVM